MNLQNRIKAFSELSNFLFSIIDKQKNDSLNIKYHKHYDIFLHLIKNEHINNGWFTQQNIRYALKSIAETTTQVNINKWIEPYQLKLQTNTPKKIATIMAGNIPLVGFHDFISILISGNIFTGKLSSKAKNLMIAISDFLIDIQPEFENYIFFIDDTLKDYDAVIATGSNNSARYFKYYFGKKPNIIRKNRNSIAIITGEETQEDLQELAHDIFIYFGLGCRNVSKIFVPKNYDFDKLYKATYKFQDIINHNKYANNYNYNRTIYLINKEKFLDNGFLMLKNHSSISSPISVLYYENYHNLNQLSDYLKPQKENIQCIVSKNKIDNILTIPFGKTQKPELWDYPDGVNIMDFLITEK